MRRKGNVNNEKKMPGKCSAYEFYTGFDRKKKIEDETEKVTKLYFPLKEAELLEKWKKNQYESGYWEISCTL